MKRRAELHAEITVRNHVDAAQGEETRVPVEEKFSAAAGRDAEVYFVLGLFGPIGIVVERIEACFQAGLGKGPQPFEDREIVPRSDGKRYAPVRQVVRSAAPPVVILEFKKGKV